MKISAKWIKIIFIIGVIAFFAGSLDPLEGSVLIAAGSALLTFSAFHSDDKHFTLYLISSILIVIGVCAMFFLSSLGGFGGNSKLSWWWGLLIIPYPIGWVTDIVLMVMRLFKKPAEKDLE